MVKLGTILAIKTGNGFSAKTSRYMKTSDGWLPVGIHGYDRGIPVYAPNGAIVTHIDTTSANVDLDGINGDTFLSTIQVLALKDGTKILHDSGNMYTKRGEFVINDKGHPVKYVYVDVLSNKIIWK